MREFGIAPIASGFRSCLPAVALVVLIAQGCAASSPVASLGSQSASPSVLGTATDSVESSATPSAGKTSADTAAVTGVTIAEANKLVTAAASDPWAISKLADASVRLVEVFALHDGKSPASVRFINYATMERFTILVDTSTYAVAGHAIDSDWPNYSPAELDLAATIALADSGVSARAHGEKLVVNNETGATDRGICLQRRCVAVFLTPPNGSYASLVVAIVDLGKNEVVGFDN